MADGSLTSASATPMEAFSASFVLDTTGPIVLNSSIGDQDTVPSGLLTWAVTFNEDLATAGLGRRT